MADNGCLYVARCYFGCSACQNPPRKEKEHKQLNEGSVQGRGLQDPNVCVHTGVGVFVCVRWKGGKLVIVFSFLDRHKHPCLFAACHLNSKLA